MVRRSPETKMRIAGACHVQDWVLAGMPRSLQPARRQGPFPYDGLMGDGERKVDLTLRLRSDEELDELERALLKARASELSEVRRRTVRLVAGYGDATTRDVMDDEGRRAQIRHDVLSELIEELRRRTGPPRS